MEILSFSPPSTFFPRSASLKSATNRPSSSFIPPLSSKTLKPPSLLQPFAPPPESTTVTAATGSGGGGRYRQSSRQPKRSYRKRFPPIEPGDRIDYRNTSLLTRFVSEQGKILARRVTRLTLKQQRAMTTAIKQARILSLLPFISYERRSEREMGIGGGGGGRGDEE